MITTKQINGEETWYKKAKEVGIAGLVYLELIHDIEA